MDGSNFYGCPIVILDVNISIENSPILFSNLRVVFELKGSFEWSKNYVIILSFLTLPHSTTVVVNINYLKKIILNLIKIDIFSFLTIRRNLENNTPESIQMVQNHFCLIVLKTQEVLEISTSLLLITITRYCINNK